MQKPMKELQTNTLLTKHPSMDIFLGRCYSELTDQGLQNHHSIKTKSNKSNTVQQHKQNSCSTCKEQFTQQRKYSKYCDIVV